MPKRIQRSQAKGWKMPHGAVYVGRGSIWGNPFKVGEPCGVFDGKDGRGLGLMDQVEILVPMLTREQCVEFYGEMVRGFLRPELYPAGHNWRAAFAGKMGAWHPSDVAHTALRGRDLACWCRLDEPCHADVLLEIANT